MKEEAGPASVSEASVLGVVKARDLCLGCGRWQKNVRILKTREQYSEFIDGIFDSLDDGFAASRFPSTVAENT